MKKIIFGVLFFSIILPHTMANQLLGEVRAGKNKAAMCMGCHGIAGYKSSYPEVYRTPMLGGQSEKYLISALEGYKQGSRNHPTMRGNAGSLTDQDRADIAAYYAQLGNATAAPETKKIFPMDDTYIAKGQAIAQKFACASCHGTDYQTSIDPSYPKLAGQPADYLEHALLAYQRDPKQMNSRNHAVMRAQVKQLSKEDIKNVAAFLANLPATLTMKH